MGGRQRILQEVRRLLSPGGVLAIIDIATDYQPSASMLAGEPYGEPSDVCSALLCNRLQSGYRVAPPTTLIVLEYKKNIHRQLNNQKGFLRTTY